MSGSEQSVVRVLVCDDSALIRGAISRIVESDPGIRVVARAANGREAVELAQRSPVDVVVLDVEMPDMDGLTALPLLLRARPAPRVVMASTLTTRGAEITMRALRLGAADCIAKPSALGSLSEGAFRRELLEKLHALAGKAACSEGIMLRPLPRPMRAAQLLAVGSSTGGPQALFTLVQGLTAELPVPVIVTQHMPASFMATLANHLDRIGTLRCAEVQENERLLPGRLYLAHGDRHMLVERRSGALWVRLDDGPARNFCRPSVDPMFQSAAAACDGALVLTILTGMGQDGLAGTRAAVGAGAVAIAQDEETSVVWGMPGAITRAGLCHAVLPLPRIAPKVLELLSVVSGRASVVSGQWSDDAARANFV